MNAADPEDPREERPGEQPDDSGRPADDIDAEFARLMEGTDSMLVWSETAVSARIAVSIVLAKSGESIALAMFREPRLHEMSRPT